MTSVVIPNLTLRSVVCLLLSKTSQEKYPENEKNNGFYPKEKNL